MRKELTFTSLTFIMTNDKDLSKLDKYQKELKDTYDELQDILTLIPN